MSDNSQSSNALRSRIPSVSGASSATNLALQPGGQAPIDISQIYGLPLNVWHALTDEERAEVKSSKRRDEAYKTALCNTFKADGDCPYGVNCRFAHGEAELRLGSGTHPKYKTQLCNKFSVTGLCPYGSRCQFIHRRLVTTPRPDIGPSVHRPVLNPPIGAERSRAQSNPLDYLGLYSSLFHSSVNLQRPSSTGSFSMHSAIPPNPFNPPSRPAIDDSFAALLDRPTSSLPWRNVGPSNTNVAEFTQSCTSEFFGFGPHRRRL
ncbi:hypothetical protein L596_003494 [Steinernema carpocapsae]|uniref:C3H1-type domain-containing protein n=1 Tax=Steinernema carpocapsae TaxID=34508 RepID=A0A4U8UVW9_STECR|nr:hypothetical protein L596_003494 [Steinernema carpocapsae]